MHALAGFCFHARQPAGNCREIGVRIASRYPPWCYRFNAESNPIHPKRAEKLLKYLLSCNKIIFVCLSFESGADKIRLNRG